MAIKTFVQTDLRVPPTDNNHLVRLGDMISYVAGLTKQAVRVVFTTPFTGAYNATALTLTQTTPAALVVDGVTLALGDRVLLAGQVDLTQNGIYDVTTLGVDGTTAAVLTRAADFNDSADIINGTLVPVQDGTTNAGTQWKLTPATVPAVLDTTSLIFTKQMTDTKRVVEMTFAIAGDGTTQTFQFAHNLATLNVTHEIRDDATGETVVAKFTRVDLNTVQVDTDVPLSATDELTLIIRAEVEPA